MRVIRLRLGWRQIDVARRAGVSQQLVSKVERGRCSGVSGATLRRLFAAVDADVVTLVRWRAGDLDRLLDEGHAAIVGQIATLLRRRGWDVQTEVTFSEFGERGSIDVLAWHPASRTLLVIEVKTEVTSAESLLRSHDAKVRLGPKIARARFGESPARVARLLVLGESQANCRRFARLSAVLASAYPASPSETRRWLRNPATPFGGVLFMSHPVLRTVRGSRGRSRLARPPEISPRRRSPAPGS